MASGYFESIDPATGERIDSYPHLSPAAIEQLLVKAQRQSGPWAETPSKVRCELLSRVADQLEQQREVLAAVATREMGKLISEALAEVDKCAWVCRYYAAEAPALLADRQLASEAADSLVVSQPLGVVLAVMPWNFPFWQVFRAAAPAIAAGNVVLLKHASNVTGCGHAINEVFSAAGADVGVFGHLPVPSAGIADIIADPRVHAVTLTGSDRAGRAVAAAAGANLKKTVLELGGSDPFVVLEDADLDLAVEKALLSRFMNCGQSCIAAKRFILAEAIADDFVARLVAGVQGLRVGDPRDAESAIGPMARADLRAELHAQVRDAVDRGARILTGGQALEGPGFYYQPTVLADVRAGMRAYAEELFGPVAVTYRVPDDQAALKLANDIAFGLGGSVWTRDRARGESLARRLECGCAFVNELVKSDPRLPFGGIKDSGYGRELSDLGLHEFVNHKTLWIN